MHKHSADRRASQGCFVGADEQRVPCVTSKGGPTDGLNQIIENHVRLCACMCGAGLNCSMRFWDIRGGPWHAVIGLSVAHLLYCSEMLDVEHLGV